MLVPLVPLVLRQSRRRPGLATLRRCRWSRLATLRRCRWWSRRSRRLLAGDSFSTPTTRSVRAVATRRKHREARSAPPGSGSADSAQSLGAASGGSSPSGAASGGSSLASRASTTAWRSGSGRWRMWFRCLRWRMRLWLYPRRSRPSRSWAYRTG